MMTCFTPWALRSDHVHFIDGARGGDGAEGGTGLKGRTAGHPSAKFSVRIGSSFLHRRTRPRSLRPGSTHNRDGSCGRNAVITSRIC